MRVLRFASAAAAIALLSVAPVSKPLPPVLDVTTRDLPKTATAAVEVRRGTIAPGGDTIWHTHPSPTFNYVASGTGTWEFKNQPSQTRSAGQAIEEPGSGS